MTPTDKYGNSIVLDDGEFKISPDNRFVTLLSTNRCFEFGKIGSYLLTLRCDKVGQTSFDVLLLHADIKFHVDNLEILPPPVCPINSYVVYNKKLNKNQETYFEAGIPITLTLFLNDVFGNQISFEGRKGFLDRIGLVCIEDHPSMGNPRVISTHTKTKDSEKGKGSLKVCHAESNGNAFVLKFTPFITGKRLFSLNVDGKRIKKSSMKITVEPGPFERVRIVSQDPPSLRIYRSRTANILVKAMDEFGNQHTGSGVEFKISSEGSFVTLMSAVYDSSKGSYVVTVRGDKTGKPSFDLIVTHGNRHIVKSIAMEIFTPPVSHSISYILNAGKTQKKIHKAGEAMKLILMLYDIYGNPISFDESKTFLARIYLATHDDKSSTCSHMSNPHVFSSSTSINVSKEEERSLKVCHADSNANACVLEFTLFITGKRLFSFDVDGKEINNSSMKMTVEPGPLKEVRIVSQDPPSIRIYRSRTANILVKAMDEFGNQYTGSDVRFNITSEGSFVTLVSAAYVKRSYVVTVRGDKTGKPSFDLIVTRGNRDFANSLAMEIFTPPVSHSMSYIPRSDIETLQKRIHKAGQVMTLQINLIDIFGNPLTTEDMGGFMVACLVHVDDDTPTWSCSGGNKNKQKEVRYLRVRSSQFDSTACEVGFTPLIPGKRWFHLEIAGKEMDNSTMKLAILPGEGQIAEVEESLCCEIDGDEVHTVGYEQHNYLEFYEQDRNILCMGVARGQLVGADQANIKNINRVLEKEYPDCKLSSDMISRNYGRLVLFDLDDFPEPAALKVMELLSILVEGDYHHRNQANELGDERENVREEQQQAILERNSIEFQKLRILIQECGRLMNENNEKSSNAIFKFYNYGRPQSEIDLHGQRVGNPDSLKQLRAKLLGENKTSAQVEEIMERERKKRDEAIRKLDERMRAFDHEEAQRICDDWLEIIDGAGHHSATKGQQRIRPKVKEYLKKKYCTYVEANEGALFVAFSEYTVEQPCVANFFCKRCKKTWTSITSWEGFFQQCYKCDAEGRESNCYPFKLRSTLPPRREGREFTRKDHRRLCGKCIQLGKDCRR